MHRIPFEYKMKEGIIKVPLKRIFKNILPQGIINRKKVGFPIPLKNIFIDTDMVMDAWLNFNLETLIGKEWIDIKHLLKKDNVYV